MAANPAIMTSTFGMGGGIDVINGASSALDAKQVASFVVTVLSLVAGGLLWRFSGAGMKQSNSEKEYWDHRRHRIVANIAQLLDDSGRQPAKKVFSAIFDDFEEIVVTEEPVGVPQQSARLKEMTELLKDSLSFELKEALRLNDVGEVEELYALVLKAHQHFELSLCESEMEQAVAYLGEKGSVRKRQLRLLLACCDREVLVWILIGLCVKIISQVPAPIRMIYISATVTAASRGRDGIHDFHDAAIMSLWLFCIEKLLQFTGRITMFRGESLFTTSLKKQVYAACLRQDMDFFDTNRCGGLQHRLNVDTKDVCQKLLYFPVRFIQFSFFLVFNLITLMSSSPRLVLATLSVLPLSLFGNLFLMKRLHKQYSRMQKRAEVSAHTTQEVLSSIRTVRMFGQEPHELLRYVRDQEYEARVSNQANMLQSMTQPIMHAISELSFFIGLYYGGLLISQGLLQAGEVITLVQGTQACTGVLTDLFETLPEIAKVGKPVSRICELLERHPRIEMEVDALKQPSYEQNPDGKNGYYSDFSEMTPSASGIEFAEVHFSYPSRAEASILGGLSFVAAPGEVLAVVGATGCGKSTIVNLLMRFYTPAQGCIFFNGRPIESYNIHWLRRQMGIVAQEPLLFATSIRANLLYSCISVGVTSPEVDDGELVRVCQLANAWEFIQKLPEGLSTEVGERGVQLSGGQKQRIAIARAVLKKPKVCVLDEATSALDVESEEAVQQALDKVIRASDCTTIVITHRLASVLSVAKVIVVAGGVVCEEGTPRDLMVRPDGVFARMVRKQSDTSSKHQSVERLDTPMHTEDAKDVGLLCRSKLETDDCKPNGKREGTKESGTGLTRRLAEELASLESELRHQGALGSALNSENGHTCIKTRLVEVRKIVSSLEGCVL